MPSIRRGIAFRTSAPPSIRIGDVLTDDAEQRRVDRREALRKAAAFGGALWVMPTLQSLNMTKAWAAAGSDPGDPGGAEEGDGGGPGSGSETGGGGASGGGAPVRHRFTVRFKVGGSAVRCSRPRGPCRCLRPETRTGGCSLVEVTSDERTAAWTITVSGRGARVIEGFSRCGRSADTPCRPGSRVGRNAMVFPQHGGRDRHRGDPISHIELTFSVPAHHRPARAAL